MHFVSLADPNERVTFGSALINGVPSDPNSLYVPEAVPRLSYDDLDILAGGNPLDIGRVMLSPYLSDEMDDFEINDIVKRATTFETPLVDVGDRKVLELWHGPTMAFKDVAASYLGALLSNSYQKGGDPVLVLVATSGDTGGAIAEGLANREGVDVVLAYPNGRVSELQKEQLRRVAGNIHSVEVEGTFDDCLDLTLAAFKDPKLREKYNLTTANSISVGRLLPQMTYYASLYQHMLDGFDGRVVVPVGNEGNLTAGLLAEAMGVPLPKFVAANNANNYMSRYLATGKAVPRPNVRTLSNAMDVHRPKNAPRIDWIFDGDMEHMRDSISGVTVTDAKTVRMIKRVYGEENGYLLDPHTAVAWSASRPGDIVVSTASPKKFAEEIQESTGIEVDNSDELEALRGREERYSAISNSPEEFIKFVDGIAD